MLEVLFREVFLSMDPDLLIRYFGTNRDTMESRIWYDSLQREMEASPFIQSSDELWAAMWLRWNPPWMIRGFLGLARLRSFMAVLLAADRLRGWTPNQGALNLHYTNLTTNCSMTQSPDDLVKLCVEQGIKVLLIPEVHIRDIRNGRGNDHEYYDIFSGLAEIWAGEGVFFLDVLDAFWLVVADSYLVDHVHMNDQGYEYLAEQVAAYFMESEDLMEGVSSTVKNAVSVRKGIVMD